MCSLIARTHDWESEHDLEIRRAIHKCTYLLPRACIGSFVSVHARVLGQIVYLHPKPIDAKHAKSTKRAHTHRNTVVSHCREAPHGVARRSNSGPQYMHTVGSTMTEVVPSANHGAEMWETQHHASSSTRRTYARTQGERQRRSTSRERWALCWAGGGSDSSKQRSSGTTHRRHAHTWSIISVTVRYLAKLLKKSLRWMLARSTLFMLKRSISLALGPCMGRDGPTSVFVKGSMDSCGSLPLQDPIPRSTPYFVFMILLLGCGASSKTAQVSEADKLALQDLVENGRLEFTAEWARPLLTNSMTSIANSGLLAPGNTAGRINLMGTAAYLRVVGDSVSAYLPYYGERNMVTGYGNTNNAIQFNGSANDLELVEDPKTHGYSLNFSVDNDTESYTVFAKIFPGMGGTININSTHRQTITYTGEVSALDPEAELN